MDIANKKRTYVWGSPRAFLGKDTTRHSCLDVSLTLYNTVSLLFFWVTRKLIYIYIFM